MDNITRQIMDNNIWSYLILSLPSSKESAKHGFWTDGEEILCKSQEAADTVADFLEGCGFADLSTGYYDPEEDKRSGTVDEHTGSYYIHNF